MSSFQRSLSESMERLLGVGSLHYFAIILFGTISTSSVYLAGIFGGLGIGFYPFVDSTVIYKCLHELVFFLAFTTVYFRMGAVQVMAMNSNMSRRVQARKRYRRMKNLPPVISSSSRYFIRPLMLTFSAALLVGAFVLIMSKFLAPALSSIWIFNNLVLLLAAFWAVARLNSGSARNLKSMKLLWDSMWVDGAFRISTIAQKRGVFSSLSLVILFSVLTLGGLRFQTLAEQPPLCITTDEGRLSASVIFTTEDGLILETSSRESYFLRKGTYEIMYLSSSKVHSVSAHCLLPAQI